MAKLTKNQTKNIKHLAVTYGAYAESLMAVNRAWSEGGKPSLDLLQRRLVWAENLFFYQNETGVTVVDYLPDVIASIRIQITQEMNAREGR